MAILRFQNNATTTLSGSINNSQTSITVTSSSSFPSLTAGDYFYATMYETSGAVEINIEIVKVTATTGSNWTVARGQDGTTARARDGVSVCYIQQRMTAAAAQLMVQKDNNLSDLPIASTARTNLGLGSMATQDASAVAITGGTISGVAITGIDASTTIQDNVDPTKQVQFQVSGITTGTTRTMTVPNVDGTLALVADLTAGYQPLDSDLTAVAALSANGLIARTATGAMAVRAVTQPAAGLTVTNGDGVSGNPTLALANDLAAVEGLTTTGFVRRTASETWSASAIVDGDLPSALTGKTYNAITPTANATGFSLAGGTTSKTLTVTNSMTLSGTDGTTITLPSTTGTVALNNQTQFIGTTSVALNRTSGALALTGVSIDGAAGSATTATTATKATHLVGGNTTTLLGAIGYQSGVDTTTLLAPNVSATKQFMAQTGTGTNGAAPVWSAVAKADVGLSLVENTALSTWAGSANLTTLGTVATGTWNATTIGIAKGGTGQTTAVAAFDALSPATTLGDTIYSDGTDNVRLAGNITATRRFMRQTGTGTVSAAPVWDTLLDADLPSALTGKTYNALSLTAASVGFTLAGGTTSKTLTVSNTLTLAGTDTSTLNIGTGGTLGSAAYTASTAYAPAAGSASIVTLGTVTAGTWTGSAIGISYGGTGAASKAAGFNALSPVTTLGDVIYGDGANSNTRLAGSTVAAKRFFTQTGTGTVSAAPGWNAIIDGDIPSALTGKTYNGVNLTANATGFSVAGGTTSKTLTVNNNLTLSGTDGSTLNIGAGGTLGTAAYTAALSLGTDVATALAVNVGTAGAPVVNGGALGTPSSGTVTNLTGTASININGTVGATTPAAVSATSLTDSGNLTFTGTGNRITGDFSNATVANRVAFQTSTANSTTWVSVLPNGTSTDSRLSVYSNSDPTNTTRLTLSATSSNVAINSAIEGTGTYVPLVFATGGTERVRVDTSGNVGIGTTSPTGGGGGTTLNVFGTSAASLRVNNSADSLDLFVSGNIGYVQTATAIPMVFRTNAVERMRIDSSGNVGIGKTPSYRLQAYVDNGATAGPVYVSVLESTSSAPGTTSGPALGFIFGTRPIASIETQRTNPLGGYGGDLVFKTNDPANSTATFAALTERMRIDASGNVGIGTASPNVKFVVQGGRATFAAASESYSVYLQNNSATAGVYVGSPSANAFQLSSSGGASLVSVDSSGNLTATGNVTAYSDERIKTDWETLPDDFVSYLSTVKSGTYTRTDNALRQVGVSAQSLRSLMPEAVLEDAEGRLSVAYGNAALAACVELARELVALRSRLAALEG